MGTLVAAAVAAFVLVCILVFLALASSAKHWRGEALMYQSDLAGLLDVVATMSPGPQTEAAVATFNEHSVNTLDPNRILRGPVPKP